MKNNRENSNCPSIRIQTAQEFAWISSVIKSKSIDLAKHSREVHQIANIILSNANFKEIPLDAFSKKVLNIFDTESLAFIYEYHDIGKAFIDTNILDFNGRLSDKDFEIIKNHVNAGVNIITSMYNGKQITSVSEKYIYLTAINIIKTHHENLDGSGYPNGIKGDKISFLGKVAKVADVISALMGTRVYKQPWTPAKTLQYLYSNIGIEFDPYVIEIIDKNWSKILKVFIDNDVEFLFNQVLHNQKAM